MILIAFAGFLRFDELSILKCRNVHFLGIPLFTNRVE